MRAPCARRRAGRCGHSRRGRPEGAARGGGRRGWPGRATDFTCEGRRSRKWVEGQPWPLQAGFSGKASLRRGRRAGPPEGTAPCCGLRAPAEATAGDRARDRTETSLRVGGTERPWGWSRESGRRGEVVQAPPCGRADDSGFYRERWEPGSAVGCLGCSRAPSGGSYRKDRRDLRCGI